MIVLSWLVVFFYYEAKLENKISAHYNAYFLEKSAQQVQVQLYYTLLLQALNS